LADREHEVARHPRELEKGSRVLADEAADDVADIAAGAEGGAGAGDHHPADARLVVQRAERVAKLVVDLERQRVQAIGTIQRDCRHAGRRIVGVDERPRRLHGSTAVASISTSASGSKSAVTSTSAIAG